MNDTSKLDFSLAYYSGNRKVGTIAVVSRQTGTTTVNTLEQGAETGLDKLLKPILVGIAGNQVVLMDAKTKQISVQSQFPADTVPAHIYPEPGSSRDWFMNDGEKESGNDTVNCGDTEIC